MDSHTAHPPFETFQSIRKLAEDAFSADYLALVGNDDSSPGDIRVVKVFHQWVSAEVIAEWLRFHRVLAIPLLPRVGAQLQEGVFEMSSYREPVFARPPALSKRKNNRPSASGKPHEQLRMFQIRALLALADTLRWLHSFGSVHGQLSADSLVMSAERVLLLGAGMNSLSGADAGQRATLLEQEWAAFLGLCTITGLLDQELTPERMNSLRQDYDPDRDFECYGQLIELLLTVSGGALGQAPARSEPPAGRSETRKTLPQLVQRCLGQLPSFLQQYLPSFDTAGSHSSSVQRSASSETSGLAKIRVQPLLLSAAVFILVLLVLLPAGGAADSGQQGQDIFPASESSDAAGDRVSRSGSGTLPVSDDPVLAAEHLLKQREECYRLGSAECLRMLYEPAASGYYRDAQLLESGADPGIVAELSGLEMVQRNGDLVLLSLVNETSPTHVHLMRVTESGWLFRDIYRLDTKI